MVRLKVQIPFFANASTLDFNSTNGAIKRRNFEKEWNNSWKISIPQMVRLKEVRRVDGDGNDVNFNSTNGAIKSKRLVLNHEIGRAFQFHKWCD